MHLPDSKTLALDEIRPYEGNPRRIPDEAIEAVRASIENYGYVQPIVVDKDHVIIVGHTRYEALKRLGYEEVEVYVSDLPPEKAREYRLVDNRTSEMTQWDHDALVLELREFEQDLLSQFFPDVNLEIEMVASARPVSDKAVEEAEDRTKKVTEGPVHHMTEVVCPACFHSFKVRTASLPGLTKAEIGELAAAGE